MKKAYKKGIGFSVLDGILALLIVACILSTVFHTQIQNFFGNEKKEEIEYTFIIEKVSEEAKNYPSQGEEIFLSEDLTSLGYLVKIAKAEKSYQSKSDPEDTMKVTNLTCQGRVSAERTEMGYVVADQSLKPGATFSAQTESATFTMVVTMVKAINE